ncbi:MAG: DUF2243 domain-containing protein [Verrucomicrobiota bacterium]|nr:DUF2243 domain-containing protein [Verrucomicrobiota bacterium]
MGLVGFFDGILFHQILQTHAMLTAKLPKTSVENIQVNMFWDGMFHVATLTLTVVGLVLLWRAVTKHRVGLSTKCFVGSILIGGGLFNFVEGLIDHHILHLHHVVENLGVSVFDYAFLASGLIMMGIGWSMVRVSKRDEQLLVPGHPQTV